MDFSILETRPELPSEKEIRCYMKADREVITDTLEIKGYSTWKDNSIYVNEPPGKYLFITLDSNDIAHNSLAGECYTVKPGTYKVELVEKDLSKEAYTYLYDDGDRKEIPINIATEISSLNAIPKEPIKCIIFADDCIETVDDEVMTSRYTYCQYLNEEDNIAEEFYVITVKPVNILFSSLHSGKNTFGYCDLIIKPGIYNIDGEGDFVESTLARLEDEMADLREKIKINKEAVKQLMLQQDSYEIDLAKIAESLGYIALYLRQKEEE